MSEIIECWPDIFYVASQALNKQTDSMAPKIEAINSAFKSLNLGIEAWSKWHPLRSSNGAYEIRLGYGRAAKWGLLIGRRVPPPKDNPQPEDFESEEWAFMEAPRMTRLEGIFYIEELMQSLVNACEIAVKEFESANEFLDEVINKVMLLKGATK